MDLDQWLGKSGEKEFQGRPDIGFKHVTAPGFSRRESDHAVNVNRRLASDQADIAEDGAGFNLMINGDVTEGLLFLIKPGKDRVLKSPDGADLGGLDIFMFCEFRQAGHNLVSLAENDGICFF